MPSFLIFPTLMFTTERGFNHHAARPLFTLTDTLLLYSLSIHPSARTLRMIMSTSVVERVEVVMAKYLKSANLMALQRHSYMVPRGLKARCV